MASTSAGPAAELCSDGSSEETSSDHDTVARKEPSSRHAFTTNIAVDLGVASDTRP